MPIIKSAKKKVRSDKRKRAHNLHFKVGLKNALKIARKEPTLDHLKAAQAVLDKAVTARVIHQNKAARLKSRLAKRAKIA